jgi:hypothetical protein
MLPLWHSYGHEDLAIFDYRLYEGRFLKESFNILATCLNNVYKCGSFIKEIVSFS